MEKLEMHNLFAFILILASTFFSRGGHAAEGSDGAFYLEVCSAAVKGLDGAKLSLEEGLSAVYCKSYIGGFLDAISLMTNFANADKIACTPERGIPIDQATRILVKYLRENPEALHQSGRILLYVALTKAFPCRK